MAGFDPTLDKELFAENVNIADNLRIKVSVMSYNDGLAKMQISRERKNREGEWSFAKLGRMTVDEVTAVMPVMQKAKEFMENLPKEEAVPAEEEKAEGEE
ncbi:hypothetical protein KY363_02060 [Candidatus Woesearchaeota archaeon]|nr:hypothetical protein [Candidatus Woesearchaeota archaeon]